MYKCVDGFILTETKAGPHDILSHYINTHYALKLTCMLRCRVPLLMVASVSMMQQPPISCTPTSALSRPQLPILSCLCAICVEMSPVSCKLSAYLCAVTDHSVTFPASFTLRCHGPRSPVSWRKGEAVALDRAELGVWPRMYFFFTTLASTSLRPADSFTCL